MPRPRVGVRTSTMANVNAEQQRAVCHQFEERMDPFIGLCMQSTVHLSPICSVHNGSLCTHEVPRAHGNVSHTSTANAAHFGILQVAQTASHLLMWFVATAASVEYAICLEAHIFISEAQLALVHCIAT